MSCAPWLLVGRGSEEEALANIQIAIAEYLEVISEISADKDVWFPGLRWANPLASA